jgi:hypothetical protein
VRPGAEPVCAVALAVGQDKGEPPAAVQRGLGRSLGGARPPPCWRPSWPRLSPCTYVPDISARLEAPLPARAPAHAAGAAAGPREEPGHARLPGVRAARLLDQRGVLQVHAERGVPDAAGRHLAHRVPPGARAPAQAAPRAVLRFYRRRALCCCQHAVSVPAACHSHHAVFSPY